MERAGEGLLLAFMISTYLTEELSNGYNYLISGLCRANIEKYIFLNHGRGPRKSVKQNKTNLDSKLDSH